MPALKIKCRLSEVGHTSTFILFILYHGKVFPVRNLNLFPLPVPTPYTFISVLSAPLKIFLKV